ncbi:hypothetical protein KCU67_g438, partial [Aureobasidium melanogenum]
MKSTLGKPTRRWGGQCRIKEEEQGEEMPREMPTGLSEFHTSPELPVEAFEPLESSEHNLTPVSCRDQPSTRDQTERSASFGQWQLTFRQLSVWSLLAVIFLAGVQQMVSTSVVTDSAPLGVAIPSQRLKEGHAIALNLSCAVSSSDKPYAEYSSAVMSHYSAGMAAYITSEQVAAGNTTGYDLQCLSQIAQLTSELDHLVATRLSYAFKIIGRTQDPKYLVKVESYLTSASMKVATIGLHLQYCLQTYDVLMTAIHTVSTQTKNEIAAQTASEVAKPMQAYASNSALYNADTDLQLYKKRTSFQKESRAWLQQVDHVRRVLNGQTNRFEELKAGLSLLSHKAGTLKSSDPTLINWKEIERAFVKLIDEVNSQERVSQSFDEYFDRLCKDTGASLCKPAAWRSW